MKEIYDAALCHFITSSAGTTPFKRFIALNICFLYSLSKEKVSFPMLTPHFSAFVVLCVRIFNNRRSLWCLSYSINDIHFPRLFAWVLDWWRSLISQQLFHGPLILLHSIQSPSSPLCHVFITVITRFSCKQNNWSHRVLHIICTDPTAEPCGVPRRWLS